jgi:hypothetical protein
LLECITSSPDVEDGKFEIPLRLIYIWDCILRLLEKWLQKRT